MGRLFLPVLILAGHAYVEDGQRLGADVFGQLEELEEAESIGLVVVRIVAVVEGVLPAVAVQRAVLDGADGVLPLIAGVEVGTFYDAAAREAEDAWVEVFQSLCQVAAHAVLPILIGVDGEQRHVLQGHRVGSLQEDAQLGVLQRLPGGQRDGVFLPLGRRNLDFLVDKLLVLAHGVLVDELDADGTIALGGLGPYAEAVLLALLDANAEVALVGQTRAALLMAGVGEFYVPGAALEGTVILQVDTAEGLPAHEVLGELERTVLDQFAVESAVSGEVDVFEEDAVHGLLDGCSQFLGVDVHDALRRGCQGGCQ